MQKIFSNSNKKIPASQNIDEAIERNEEHLNL